MNLAIETEDLGKRYGDVRAVEHLSLRVAEGEIYAFLGLNGAGKTTTIRMLLGMIKPTSGTAHVLQTRVRLGSREPWASVGYLVETPHGYPELTVHENLEVARRLHPGTTARPSVEIIERLGLAAYADRRAGTLSQGNAQRLGLAKALLHDPRLLLLDEPANGLDPAGIVEIRELLLELTREQGVTVFMSSHILAEVSRLAQRIGIIHKGACCRSWTSMSWSATGSRRLLVRARDMRGGPPGTDGRRAARRNPPGRYHRAQRSPPSIERPDDIASLLVQCRDPAHPAGGGGRGAGAVFPQAGWNGWRAAK